ncbi:MAG TPA: hypothetical protein PLN52_19420 [Opitutaceae bacterium]|nr:hypothetical protein [Opitutaceae bacterium]
MKPFCYLVVVVSLLMSLRWVAAKPLDALRPTATLAERIDAIDRFVHDHYYDAAGLMRSHIKWDEERPFTAEDFKPSDSVMGGPEPHQWMSYENSPFIAGFFLAAQCYRFEATQDPLALVYARRAYEALDAIYRLNEQPAAESGPTQKAGIIEVPTQGAAPRGGFFCKPYYGHATDHTSTEQHFGPLIGLYRYWRHAPPELKPRIREIFSAVSKRWRAGYKINYFGETWNLEESNPRAQRHMFLWSVMHRLAFEVTQEPECLAEFRRLDALYGAIPTPRETMFGLGRPSYISTEDRQFHVQIVIGAELLADLERNARDRYLRGMRKWWEYSQTGQRDDLTAYYFIQVDTLTGEWTKLPTTIKHRAHWRSPFMIHNATLPIVWVGIRERQALTSSIVARYVPEVASVANARAHQIFTDLDKEHLKWFLDPEGVVPPPMRWMLNVLQGDALAFYSLGYWYARANDLPVARPQ